MKGERETEKRERGRERDRDGERGNRVRGGAGREERDIERC